PPPGSRAIVDASRGGSFLSRAHRACEWSANLDFDVAALAESDLAPAPGGATRDAGVDQRHERDVGHPADHLDGVEMHVAAEHSLYPPAASDDRPRPLAVVRQRVVVMIPEVPVPRRVLLIERVMTEHDRWGGACSQILLENRHHPSDRWSGPAS